MSPEGCQAAWQSSLLPFGFEHAQYTPSAQALQKLLWSSADTRACGGYLKSETQLAQEDKVLFLYLIFSALEWGLGVGWAPPPPPPRTSPHPTFSQVSFLSSPVGIGFYFDPWGFVVRAS